MSSTGIQSRPTASNGGGLRRRPLGFGLAALAAPCVALAQQPAKVWRIGLLHVGTDHVPPAYVPLKEGMRALGYEEGRNIRYDFRNVDSDAADAAELQRLFAALKPGTAEAVLFASGVLQHRHQALVLALATQHGMPLVATRRAWVEQGALFAYNFDFARQGRLAANRYIDRILKGKLPADLPLEEITEYQLVVNRGTAKRYAMSIPQSVLIRAHEVIE